MSGHAIPLVRRYRTPKGALRQLEHGCEFADTLSQKAPSAKRSIKTRVLRIRECRFPRVRKRRAPKGALRHGIPHRNRMPLRWSESTERQKEH